MAKCKDEIELAKRIDEMVRHCGLSQKVIAKRIGVTEGALSRYMSGKRTPKATVAYRICVATSYPIFFLFGYECNLEALSEVKVKS